MLLKYNMNIIDNHEVFTLTAGDIIPYAEFNTSIVTYIKRASFITHNNSIRTNYRITINYKNKIITCDNDVYAIEIKDEFIGIVTYLWVKNGVIHRDTVDSNGKLQPACIVSGNFLDINVMYYINGKLIFDN